MCQRRYIVIFDALSGIFDANQPGAPVLPPVSGLTEFSQRIAEAVAQSVIDQGLNGKPIADVAQEVTAAKWVPRYDEI